MYAYTKETKKANIIIWQIRERSQKYEVTPNQKIRQNISEWDFFTKKSNKPTRNYSCQAFFFALVSMQILHREIIYLLRYQNIHWRPFKKGQKIDSTAIVHSFAHRLHFYENSRQRWARKNARICHGNDQLVILIKEQKQMARCLYN